MRALALLILAAALAGGRAAQEEGEAAGRAGALCVACSLCLWKELESVDLKGLDDPRAP